MHNYPYRGELISQTLDQPITIFDHFYLSDAFVSLFVILILGVFFYQWWLMMLTLGLSLGVWPFVRRRFPKGFLLHFPFFRWGMNLPGLFNPHFFQRKV